MAEMMNPFGGYVTMMDSQIQNIDRLNRLKMALGEAPARQQLLQGQASLAQQTAQEYPTMRQATMQGTPWEREQFAQKQAQQQMEGQRQAMMLANQIRHQQETERRNAATEAETARYHRDQAANQAAAADPLGLRGTQPAAPGQAQAPQGQMAPTGAAISPIPETPMNQGIVGGGLRTEKLNEQYLSTLPIPARSIVKGIVSGDLPITAYMMGRPQGQALVAAATQYDPSFNAGTFALRNAVKKDFTSGQMSRGIQSFNQVIDHLNELQNAADALKNVNLKRYNNLANFLAVETGDPRVVRFNTVKNAVGTELMRAWRQAGVGSEREIEAWSKPIEASGSPAQLNTAISELGKLIAGGTRAIENKWQTSMGEANPVPKFLSKRAASIMERLAPGELGKSLNEPVSGKPKPTAADLAYVKAHPEVRGAFVGRFGEEALQ